MLFFELLLQCVNRKLKGGLTTHSEQYYTASMGRASIKQYALVNLMTVHFQLE
jgi:hypothetical protein